MSTQVICRVCMALAAPETSWNLFDLEAGTDGLSLAQLVALVGGIEVRLEEEGLPAWCCFQCQLDVGTAYQLRVLCQESDRELREMLASAVGSEPGAVFKIEVEEPVESNAAAEADMSELIEDCSDSKQDNNPADRGKIKKRKKLKCSYCPKLLATRQGLQFHEYGHRNPFAWKCTRCPEVFTNYNLYRTHSRIHRLPKSTNFRCGTCNERFKLYSSLRKHEANNCNSQKIHQEKRISPEIIGGEEDLIEESKARETSQEVDQTLVELIREDTFDDNMVCKIEIQESTIRSPDTEKENEEVESTNDTQCQESELFDVIPTADQRRCCACRLVFPNETSLLKHATEVHKIGDPPKDTATSILCNICYKLIYRHSYSGHGRTPKTLFRCKACDELFFSKKMILTHNMRDHSKTGKCCGCRQIFASVEALCKHSIQVHLPERRPPNEDRKFECNVCYRAFKFIGHLHEHRSRSNHFVCATCKKGFDFRRELRRHEAIHRDPTIYTCRHCSKVFDDYTYFLKHDRMVHRQRPSYHCKPCGIAYKYRSTLMRHNIKHHGIPGPYACDLCSKSFALAADLKNHARKLHPEAPLSVKVESGSGGEEGQELVCKLEVEEPKLAGLDESEGTGRRW